MVETHDPGSIQARLLAMEQDRAQYRSDPAGWFERISELFYRETGILAPGRSVPLAMGGMWTDDERQSAWQDFLRRRSESQGETLREAAAALSSQPPTEEEKDDAR